MSSVRSPQTVLALVLTLFGAIFVVAVFVVAVFAATNLSAAEPSTTPAAKQPATKAAPQVKVKVLRADKLKGKLDGKPMTATMLEVTLDPLASSPPHRHPGPLTGYVAEGTFEFQIGDGPLQTFKQGDTFFESAMILHRVSRNSDPQRKTRLIVTMIHPSDAKQLVIPEPQKP